MMLIVCTQHVKTSGYLSSGNSKHGTSPQGDMSSHMLNRGHCNMSLSLYTMYAHRGGSIRYSWVLKCMSINVKHVNRWNTTMLGMEHVNTTINIEG